MIKPPRPSPYSRTLALVPPLMVLTVQIAEAGAYLKIGDSGGSNSIPGESTETTHLNWIEAISFQFGVANPASLASGSLTASKATGSDLVITKVLDKASPALFLSCAQGTKQSKVTLDLTKTGTSGQVVFYRITLTNVIVSSLSTTGTDDGSRPSESVSLSYETITTDYFLPDAKGNYPTTPTATSTWNFAGSGAK